MPVSNKKNVFIVLTVILAIIVFVGIWNYLISKRAAPGEVGSVELSSEVLKSLTPPEGAEPIELSPAVLKSLTPPEGAVPAELSPEVLKSLTPQ